MLQLEHLEHTVPRHARQRELPDDDIRSPDGGDDRLTIGAGSRERRMDGLRHRGVTASRGDGNRPCPCDPGTLRSALQHQRAHDAGADVEAHGALSTQKTHWTWTHCEATMDTNDPPAGPKAPGSAPRFQGAW